MPVDNKINLAIFISGRGSNLQSLIDACSKADYPARIALVISNKKDAQGLKRADEAGLQTELVNRTDYSSKSDFESALMNTLAKHDIDLICLAGFMAILSANFLDILNTPIINIHPSLLPLYKGLDTHARALADGQKEAGCSVHYVVPDIDSGEIIVQRSVSILDDDTKESLAARVLEQEHIAYPDAVERLAKDMLSS